MNSSESVTSLISSAIEVSVKGNYCKCIIEREIS